MQKNFHLLHILISLKAVISRREPLRPGFESPTNRFRSEFFFFAVSFAFVFFAPRCPEMPQ